jgi:GNAT superfamily N-acetyltransferase
MFFRVRASLTDRPGALAMLATRCGDGGLNILGLQIFANLGHVTDEMVIDAPDNWTARAVAELVSGAGGDEVSVEPCTTHDLIDQPTRWLAAARDVVADPTLIQARLEELLGPHPEKWSAIEHSRAAALRAMAEPGGESAGEQADLASTAPVEYAETASGVVARTGGHMVGGAAFALNEGRELTIEVAPAWRRLGIGTNLLTRAASQAAASGAVEIVLLAPSEDMGFVTMLDRVGLRARIKVSDGLLRARIVVTGVRRSDGPAVVAREDPVAVRR